MDGSDDARRHDPSLVKPYEAAIQRVYFEAEMKETWMLKESAFLVKSTCPLEVVSSSWLPRSEIREEQGQHIQAPNLLFACTLTHEEMCYQ